MQSAMRLVKQCRTTHDGREKNRAIHSEKGANSRCSDRVFSHGTVSKVHWGDCWYDLNGMTTCRVASLGTRLAGRDIGDTTMSEIYALGTGLMMTAVAVGAGGLALEGLLIIFSRALGQNPPSTHREVWPLTEHKLTKV